MAISHVISTSTSSSGGASPSCAFGGSYTPQLNDLVVAIYTSASTGITLSATPAGWVNPLGSTVDIETDAHETSIGYHFVTAGEVSAVTTTYTPTNWFSGAQTVGIVGVVLRGVDTTTPIDDIATTFDSTNTVTPHVIPGLTGANLGNNSMVVGFLSLDGTSTYTDPAGWTLCAKNSAGQQGRAAYRCNTLTTAGNNFASQNVTPSTGDEYIGIAIAFTDAAITLQPAGGSLTLTGSAPSLDSGIRPSGGSLTLTGSAPSLDTGIRPAAGSLALTGGTPSLDSGIRPTAATLTLTGASPQLDSGIRPGGGSLTLTGFAPVIQSGVFVAPSGASLILTGSAPTITASDHKLLQPGSVTLTLTGSAPAVTASDHKNLQPTSATLTFTGSAPSLDSGIRPTAGVLTLTGAAPRLDSGIRPGGASLSLSGSAPTVLTPVLVTPNGAALALTGQVPIVVVPVMPTGATLALTGHAPVITNTNGINLTPTGATLSLTGSAPTILTPVTVIPSGALASLSGAVPTVTASDHQRATPDAAVLTLSGSVPLVFIPVVVDPQPAMLALSGAAPQLHLAIHPSGAVLVLSGDEPDVVASLAVLIIPASAEMALVGGMPIIRTISVPTPSERTLSVRGEVRLITVPLVARTTTPGDEDRIFEVPA